jgi:hypothetical protein
VGKDVVQRHRISSLVEFLFIKVKSLYIYKIVSIKEVLI